METLDIVKEVLAENLDIQPETVTQDATFDTLGVDSLDMVELICEIEDRCEISFGEPSGLATVSQLVEYIDSLK